MKISDTKLSNRAKNALRRNGIFTTFQMMQAEDLSRLAGVGKVTIKEVNQWIKKRKI